MWTLQDAKNKFSAAIDEALAGRPEEVTQRGKPAAVILPVEEYYRLVNAVGSERQFRGSSAQVYAFLISSSDRMDNDKVVS